MPREERVGNVIPLLISVGGRPSGCRMSLPLGEVLLRAGATQAYAYMQAELLRKAVGVLDRVGLKGKRYGTTRCQTRHLEGVVGKPLCNWTRVRGAGHSGLRGFLCPRIPWDFPL
jgi:hypothetical protein